MEIMAWFNSGLVTLEMNKSLVVATVGVVASGGIGWWSIRPWLWGLKMKREREEVVKVLFVDASTSFIEDAVSDGTYTREEAIMLYRNLKKCFPIRDLYPSVHLLKEDIQKRMASGTHAAVDLPPKKRKHCFEQVTL